MSTKVRTVVSLMLLVASTALATPSDGPVTNDKNRPGGTSVGKMPISPTTALWLEEKFLAFQAKQPPAAVRLRVDWDGSQNQVLPTFFGHNSVWSRGALGIWDESDPSRPRYNPEVERLVKDLRPGVLRFPGGHRGMLYHFDQTIGPREKRRPQCDPFTGKMDATSLGLDEFLRYAENVGSEVTLVAPWFESTPEEIAAMVAYVRGTRDSTVRIGEGSDENGRDWGTVGDWARLREAYGHGVYAGAKYLEVGNEQWGEYGVGPAQGNCAGEGPFFSNRRKTAHGYVPTTARDYATRAARIARLVKRVDPTMQVGVAAMTELKLENVNVLTLHSEADRKLSSGDAWNPTLQQLAGDAFDFYVVHQYRLLPRYRLWLADDMARVASQLRTLDPRKGLAVTEFGFYYSGDTLLNAIVSADMIRVAVENRFLMLLRHILVEDEPSGLFANSAAIVAAKYGVYTTPGYDVVRLLAHELGRTAHSVSGQTGDVKAIATRTAEGTLAIALIGRGQVAGHAVTVRINLPPGGWGGQRTTYSGTLSSTKDDVKVQREQIPIVDNGQLVVTIPGQSVSLLRLTHRGFADNG